MNSDIAIRVEGLGKKYLIGHQSAERGTTFREAILQGTKNLTRMGRDMLRGRALLAGDAVEEFWALRDLSFEIRRGDVVGVIGRNGAGKSTLLKLLTRITEPSNGRILINGRIASLLEVGTGFHPELSGRDNIFLNGAILGMRRVEIRRKFDEIVAFSEVEKFLDTPVKRYSSGMYVRLAFAVAAHLEPEILVVDEVLAVGDMEFQRRCLGKMKDVSQSGRTVLFVSHNIAAITYLCNSALLLQHGQLQYSGPTEEAVNLYLLRGKEPSSSEYTAPFSKNISPHFDLIRPTKSNSVFGVDEAVEIVIVVKRCAAPDLVVGIHFWNDQEVLVMQTSTEVSALAEKMNFGDELRLTVSLPPNSINVGKYHCDFVLAERNRCFHEQLPRAISFAVIDPHFNFAGTRASDWKGMLTPRCARWHIESIKI